LFTNEEIEFINWVRFARIATSVHDRPHVVPGRAFLEDGKIIVPGWEMKRSYKFRQVQQNPWMSVVWDIRGGPEGIKGVEVRGRGTAIEDPDNADETMQYRIELTPTKVFSWGIHEPFRESFQKKMGYPLDRGHVTTPPPVVRN
jgi:hypothetical protein